MNASGCKAASIILNIYCTHENQCRHVVDVGTQTDTSTPDEYEQKISAGAVKKDSSQAFGQSTNGFALDDLATNRQSVKIETSSNPKTNPLHNEKLYKSGNGLILTIEKIPYGSENQAENSVKKDSSQAFGQSTNGFALDDLATNRQSVKIETSSKPQRKRLPNQKLYKSSNHVIPPIEKIPYGSENQAENSVKKDSSQAFGQSTNGFALDDLATNRQSVKIETSSKPQRKRLPNQKLYKSSNHVIPPIEKIPYGSENQAENSVKKDSSQAFGQSTNGFALDDLATNRQSVKIETSSKPQRKRLPNQKLYKSSNHVIPPIEKIPYGSENQAENSVKKDSSQAFGQSTNGFALDDLATNRQSVKIENSSLPNEKLYKSGIGLIPPIEKIPYGSENAAPNKPWSGRGRTRFNSWGSRGRLVRGRYGLCLLDN